MLCEICKRQMASMTRRLDRGYGEEKLAICYECANKMDNEPSSKGYADFFWGREEKITKCVVCGTSLSEIKRTRYVGCSECYKIFAKEIDELISLIHGRNEHVGRMPLSVSNRIDEAPTASSVMKSALEISDYDKAVIARNHFPSRGGGLDARHR